MLSKNWLQVKCLGIKKASLLLIEPTENSGRRYFGVSALFLWRTSSLPPFLTFQILFLSVFGLWTLYCIPGGLDAVYHDFGISFNKLLCCVVQKMMVFFMMGCIGTAAASLCCAEAIWTIVLRQMEGVPSKSPVLAAIVFKTLMRTERWTFKTPLWSMISMGHFLLSWWIMYAV